MTSYRVKDGQLYRLDPQPRPLRDELIDDLATILALAIPAGMALLVILAWLWGGEKGLQ